MLRQVSSSHNPSTFVEHKPCPACRETGGDRAGDNLAIYSDGHGYCNKCGHYSKGEEEFTGEPLYEEVSIMQTITPRGVSNSAIRDRRISSKITSKFGVTVAFDKEGKIEKHYYPYYDSNESNRLLGYKERTVATKEFQIVGTNKGSGLFGQNANRSGGKYLTICEGEIDALSISEMFDGKWQVVSLKNGASSSARDIKDNLEYIESFDNVVLCFDQDQAGFDAVKSCQDIISVGKLKICKLPMKDASEMLMAGKVKEFTNAWWSAESYTPAGIIKGSDTWEHLVKDENLVNIDYPWQGLNKLTYGFRAKELVTITSGSGMGKTSVVKELESYILNTTDDNLAIIHLEESIERSVKGLMSIEANAPIHIPQFERELSAKEKKSLWQKSVGDKNVYFYDHFGSMSEDSLLNVIRTYAKSYDCQWIVLDHLSIVVSDQDGILDERKAIDAIMTKLRKIVQETGVGLFLISHLRRPQGKPHEEGGQVSLSELRGSAAIAQLSDIVIGLERNQQDDDPIIRNQTTLRVIKNRFSGLTGKACKLQYDSETGRLTEVLEDVDSFF
jgi:twinkle protein